jgi:hypothetical protein
LTNTGDAIEHERVDLIQHRERAGHRARATHLAATAEKVVRSYHRSIVAQT